MQGFSAAMQISPTPSRLLARALALAHGVCAVLGGLAFAAAPLGLLAVLVATALHWVQLRRRLGVLPRVLFDSNDQWWLLEPHAQRVPVALHRHAVITTWAMLLPLQHHPARPGVLLVLLPDSLPADDFRRLRVRLLWQRPPRRAEA
ncbi:MAG: hypothetical protein EXR83_13545 [Gammaproteobacteria bacterium]|nr:hypothetical protein [Gammaproteobacteria bacterium]